MDDLRLTSLNLPGINENKRPLVIAGPCSAETEEQVMTTARQLAEKGFKIFRAGVWKPRTKPGGFEGMGEAALPWLQRVKEETGMLVSTEVAMPKHVEASLKAGVDLLWVGARTTANPFAMQDMGFSGLIVESHCNPDCAWSDAKQQVMPDVLDFILDRLVIRENVEMTESLSALRKQIDALDNDLMDLLTRRMRVSREIATYKKEHDMAVVQTGRYSEILDKRGAQGVLCGMDAEFVKKIYEAIHEESVRQQMDIINK